MKHLTFIVLLLLSGIARCTDALVLISPERAAPIVDESRYIQGEWLLWPPEDRPSGSNRLLSLLTGMDWTGTKDELVFGLRDGKYLSLAIQELGRRGYFVARDQVVQAPSFAVGSASGFARPAALFLAMDGRSLQVTPLTLKDRWPPGVAFAEAESWDEVAAIAGKAGGRVLVVEYPPQPDDRWSRYWLRGSGWGTRLPTFRDFDVPGLIPASQAGALLLHPNRFRWVENDAGNWGGANRWLTFIHHAGPLTFSVLSFLAGFLAGCTVYLISTEEHARLGGTSLKYLTLLPATVLLAGQATRWLGPPAFVLALCVSFSILVLASQALGAFFKSTSPRANPMLALALVGLVATALSPPLWSLYSNVLGINPLPLSPEAVGSLFAYLVGVCAFVQRAGPIVWLGRFLVLATLLWGVLLNPWWVAGQWPFAALPLVALFVGEGRFRLWTLPVFGLLPLADGRLLRHGVVWAPGNLYPSLTSRDSLNFARHAEFFMSFGFLVSFLVAGAMAVFVERYFFHEIRRTLLRDPRMMALFQAAAACAAMGLFQPLMLYPALFCAIGGGFLVLADAARTV